MKGQTSRIEVVFRKVNSTGEIIALFPEEAVDQNPDNCLGYMSRGQHVAVFYDRVMKDSIRALEKDFQPLKEELENLGYNLHVRRTAPRGSFYTRFQKIQQ